MSTIDLHDWLSKQPPALAAVVAAIAQACVRISEAVGLGPLIEMHGETQQRNVHGEVQHRLDLFADRCLATALGHCPRVAGWVSEEQDEPIMSSAHSQTGQLLVAFDPLDGSSNAESNGSIGTIFSVLPHPFHGTLAGAAGFLQPGRKQLAAGYVIYGAATVLALSVGQGVVMFTLDRRDARWRLTREAVQVPRCTTVYAINASNQRFWEKPVQRYVAECLAGEEGPRGRNYNMRWAGCFVGDVHRILSLGGVYLYPRDGRQPRKPGRLRLLYEAAPMAMLLEQAGGMAVTGTQALLDVAPDMLHETVPVILGSRDEVQRIVDYHADPQENMTWQLFKTRSLFVQPQA